MNYNIRMSDNLRLLDASEVPRSSEKCPTPWLTLQPPIVARALGLGRVRARAKVSCIQ